MEPSPPPEIPRKALWASLLIPPGITLLLSLLTEDGNLILAVPLLGIIAILFCQGQFTELMKRRYQGRSVALMGFFFFMGQVIICTCLWFGTCLAANGVF